MEECVAESLSREEILKILEQVSVICPYYLTEDKTNFCIIASHSIGRHVYYAACRACACLQRLCYAPVTEATETSFSQAPIQWK